MEKTVDSKSVILLNWQHGDATRIAKILQQEGITVTSGAVGLWRKGNRPNSRIAGAIEKAAAKLQAERKQQKIERIKKILYEHPTH